MASPPLNSLMALTTMVVVASLSIHPSLTRPRSIVQSKYICGFTQYQNQCGDHIDLPEISVITINLVTMHYAANGANACQELPDNATLANVKVAYSKCAKDYHSLQKNVLQTRKYFAAKQNEQSSLLDMVEPQDLTNDCSFHVNGHNCWALKDIA